MPKDNSPHNLLNGKICQERIYKPSQPNLEQVQMIQSQLHKKNIDRLKYILSRHLLDHCNRNLYLVFGGVILNQVRLLKLLRVMIWLDLDWLHHLCSLCIFQWLFLGRCCLDILWRHLRIHLRLGLFLRYIRSM